MSFDLTLRLRIFSLAHRIEASYPALRADHVGNMKGEGRVFRDDGHPAAGRLDRPRDLFTPGFIPLSTRRLASPRRSMPRSRSSIGTGRRPIFVKLRLYYPAIRDADLPETKTFERALRSAFEFVARDGAFELRRRVKTVDETVCAGIAE